MKNIVILWVISIGLAVGIGWYLHKEPTIPPPNTDKYQHQIDSLIRYNDSLNYRDWETDRKSTRLNSSH